MRIVSRLLFALAAIVLSACQQGDWRAQAIAAAENQMRADVKTRRHISRGSR